MSLLPLVIPPPGITNLETEILEVPLYKSMSLHDPEAYQAIVTQYKSVFRKGNSLVDLQDKVRPTLQDILEERMPYASNDALREFAHLILVQTATLYDIDPEFCDIFLGAYLSANINLGHIVSYFPPELVKKEHEVISSVIMSSYNSTIEPLDEAKMEPLRLMVFDKVSTEYVNAGKVLTDVEYAVNNTGSYCQVNTALYQAMLDLPEKSSGDLIRYIFSE